MKSPAPARRTRMSTPRSRNVPSMDVLDQFTDAVLVLDRERKIVFVNQASEELIGRPKSRILGQSCLRVFPRMPVLEEMIERVEQQGQSESHSEEHLLGHERAILVRITCLPLWDDGDRVRGTALVIHDLSYQRTLEESARRNESLARLGTLVAGLAHEVRNPLAGIKGAAQLLEGRLAGDPNLQEYTQVICREVNRLSDLVQDLLTLGAPPKPQLRALNIHWVIQHVLQVANDELTRAGIRLRCEFDPSLPDVLGDEAQLSQVLLNLLKNAIESMTAMDPVSPDRNTIRITSRMETDFHILRERDRSGQFLRIEVADQGSGIDAAHAAHVFEPFFTTKPRGTGLGLAISHRIVDEHGGILRAFPGRSWGTIVSLTLPVVPS